MRCPTCGFSIDQPDLTQCPRCGNALPAPAGQSEQSSHVVPSGQGQTPPEHQPYPAYPPPPGAWTPQVNEANSYGAQPQGQPGSYGQPAPYSQPGYYGAYAPPSGPYGQPYGQPAPPSGYGPYYGQVAPPSYPMAPGYPQPGYPQPLLAPLPVRKRRTGLIIGSVAAVVVVLAACTWGTLATVQALHLPSQTDHARVTPIPVYYNSFLSNDDGWLDDGTHCFLRSDGYHIADYECFAPGGNRPDVDIKVEVKLVSGSLRYPMGIVFRLIRTGQYSNHYTFAISGNGWWELLKCSGGSCSPLIDGLFSSAIHTGVGASNTLEVYAKGPHMSFFINGTAVGSFDDSTYSDGRAGLLCGQNMECAFTNFELGEID